MERAVVEADGRIRLPDEIREAAHLEVGQELDVAYVPGQVMLFNGEVETIDETEHYSSQFLASLDETVRNVRAGNPGGQFHESTDAFLASLEQRDRDSR